MKRFLLWIEPFLRSLYARYEIPLADPPEAIYPADYNQLRTENEALRLQISEMRAHPAPQFFPFESSPRHGVAGAHGSRTGRNTFGAFGSI